MEEVRINRMTLNLYWELGADILEKQVYAKLRNKSFRN